MGMQRAVWKIVAQHYACATCNAAPGDPCLRPGGRKAGECHVARTRLAAANHWHDPDEVDSERSQDPDRRV